MSVDYAEPCCEVSPLAKGGTVADGGDDMLSAQPLTHVEAPSWRRRQKISILGAGYVGLEFAQRDAKARQQSDGD